MPDIVDQRYDDSLALPREFRLGKVRNYAKDERVVTRIKKEIIPLLQEVRDRRRPLNDMWNSMLKVWTLEHEAQSYFGDTNIYVPAGRKGAETIVAQLVSGTFPSDDNFGVDARRKEDLKAALTKKEILRYQIDKQAKVRVGAERFYRQLVMTGNSPYKFFWDRKVIPSMRRRGPRAIPDVNETVLYNGPVFKSIDINNLYYWPENVDDPSDAVVIFEDMSVPVSQLWRRVRDGIYVEAALSRLSEQASLDALDYNTQARLRAQGIPSPHTMSVEGWGLVDVTEVYLDFDPAAKGPNDERAPVPFKIVIANGEVLSAIRNPWWHQRPPYLLGRMGTLVGRLYGTGLMESIRELNLLLNDQVNHGMDAVKYALNPIFLTNPNMILGAIPELEPGMQVLAQDINAAMKTITPDMSVINAIPSLTTGTMGWIMDFMGAPPVLQGGSAPGRAFRTAAGVNRAQQNATVPLAEVIRLCEKEVWEPMLWGFDFLTEQFADEEYVLNASAETLEAGLGADGIWRVDPRELAADVRWRWLASTQTDNKLVKGDQIIQLLNLLSAPPVVQAFVMNRLQFNPYPLVRRLMTEVMGFREVDDVIVQAAVQSMGGMPGQPQGLPPNIEPTGNGAGGNPEVAAVRMEADPLAAMMGAMNSPGGMMGLTEEDEM